MGYSGIDNSRAQRGLELHCKLNDSLYARFCAALQNAQQVFGSVIQEGQKRTQPHHRGHARLLELPQRLQPGTGGADVGFEDAAKPVVPRGSG